MSGEGDFLSVTEIYSGTTVTGFSVEVAAHAYGYVQLHVEKPGRDWVREIDLAAVAPFSGTRDLPPPMQYTNDDPGIRTGYRWSSEPYP